MTLTIVNLICSFIAAIVHSYAASRVRGGLRLLFSSISCLAWIYLGSYIWLVFHLDESKVWAENIRPLGGPAWLLAWILEPLIIIRYFTHRAEGIVKVVHENEVMQRAKDTLGE